MTSREFVLLPLGAVIALLIALVYPNRPAELIVLAVVLCVALYVDRLWGLSGHYVIVLVIGRPLFVLAAFVFAAIGAFAITQVFFGPIIERVEPRQVFVGDRVSIVGKRFAEPPGGAVTVNGLPAAISTPSHGSPMEIVAVIPEGVQPGQAVVRVHKGWFLRHDTRIDVIGCPVVSDVKPAKGFPPVHESAGTTVEITGMNFGRQSGGGPKARVTFGVSAPILESQADKLVVQVPANAPRGTESELTVQTPSGVAGHRFYVYGQPRIDRVMPQRGFAQTNKFNGTRVRISGSEFDDLYRDNVVLFGGAQARVTEVSFNEVVAHVPQEARTGKIVVGTRMGTVKSRADFSVIGRPRVDHFHPVMQAPDEVVEITGQDFGHDAGDNRVLIGGVEATVTGTDPDGRALTILVPRNAADGLISLTTPAGTATSLEHFQIIPKVTRFSPRGGPPATSVTVYGYGFLPNATVRLGESVPSQVGPVATIETGEQAITFAVPSGAMEGNVTVINDAQRKGTSTERFFIYRELKEIRFRQFSPRSVEYRYGGKTKVYRTDCDRNLVHVSEASRETTVSVEQCPTDIALHPDLATARAYVTNFGANTISVVDIQIDQVVDTIKGGANPVRIVILHGWLHVLNAGVPQAGVQGTVRSISLGDPTRIVENSVGLRPVHMLVDEKRGWVYVLNRAGEITGILAEAPSKTKVIRTGALAEGFRLRRGKAYVTNFGNDSVSVVDLYADRVVKVIALGTGAAPFGIAVHPRRPEVFVTKSGHDAVAVIDAERDLIAKAAIKVGKRPLGIGLSPSGSVGLVVNSADSTVSVLDPEMYKVRGDPIRLSAETLVDVEIKSEGLGLVFGPGSLHEIQLGP